MASPLDKSEAGYRQTDVMLREGSFPVLWDDRGRALRSYHVPGTSYAVLLDARGRVVYTGAGPDQDLLEAVAAVVTSAPLGR